MKAGAQVALAAAEVVLVVALAAALGLLLTQIDVSLLGFQHLSAWFPNEFNSVNSASF